MVPSSRMSSPQSSSLRRLTQVSKRSSHRFSQTTCTKKEKPTIIACSDKDYTRVTFWPDLSKFGMEKLDDDIVALMKKRAYDIAGSTTKKVKVVLNGKKLPVGSFQ